MKPARPTFVRLLVMGVVVLSTALGVQAAHAPTAAAATGPTAVDDVVEVSVSHGGRLPYAANDVAGSAPLRLDRSGFPKDQLASLPAGSAINANGSIVDIGGGPELVMRSDGTIEVHPVKTGRWTVKYRIVDTNGATAEASFTVTLTAGGVGEEIDTVQGRAATVDVLANDLPGRNADGTLGTLDPTSVRFPAQQPLPVTVSPDGRTLTDAGVGVFTLDPVTGKLTFTPAFDYVGNGGELQYSARDTTRAADGSVQHHTYTAPFRWSVTAVVRLVVSQSVSPKHFDHVGQVLTWSAKVANVGPSVLTDLALSESTVRLSARTCAPVALGGTLARGQSTICTATSTVEQRDFDQLDTGQADTVTATATATQDGHTFTTSALAGTFAAADVHGGLSLTTTASPSTVTKVGQVVTYTVVAHDPGNLSVRNLVVSDSAPGLSALVCTPTPLGGSLGDSQSTTCRATRTITAADLGAATLKDTFKATAVPPAGIPHPTALNAVSTVTVATRALPPKATDDTVGAVNHGPDVILPGATNDQPGEPGGPAIDPSRTVFTGPDAGPDYGGKLASNDGGDWSVRPDGSIRLSLGGINLAGFVATMDYRVYDTAGHSSVGHLRVPVRPGPQPVAHHATTPQGQAVTVDVLGSDDPGQNADGTRSTFDPASLKVFADSFAFPRTEGPDGKSVDLAGAGRFAVVAGRITFTPAVGFVGTVPAAYTVFTTSGARLDSRLDVTVQAVAGGPGPVRPTLPVATDDHIVTTTQIATALPAQQNDIPGSSPFVNSKLTFPGDQLARLPKGSTIVYANGVTLTVPGQGTYVARFGTQDVLFTPKLGFVGDTTPVDYRVTDTAGNSARATLSVTVLPGVTARPDTARTPQGQPVSVDVRANDDLGPSPTTWTTRAKGVPHLTKRGQPAAVLSGTFQEKLTVPGQGVYTVNPGNGVVTFTPEPGFVGVSTATLGVMTEVERPDQGTETLGPETTLTVTVVASTPVARADTASTTVGHPVVVPVLGNDSPGSPAVPLVGASVRLRLAPGLPTGSTLYGDAKTLVVAGRGVFLVSGTGQVTFVPLGPATGPVPTIGYQVADVNGTTARSTLALTVG